jgi:hypothetical protein
MARNLGARVIGSVSTEEMEKLAQLAGAKSSFWSWDDARA